MLAEDRFCPHCGEERALGEEKISTIEIELPPPPSPAFGPSDSAAAGDATVELRIGPDGQPLPALPAAEAAAPPAPDHEPPPAPPAAPESAAAEPSTPGDRPETTPVDVSRAPAEAPQPPPPPPATESVQPPPSPPPAPREPAPTAAAKRPARAPVQRRPRRQTLAVVVTVVVFVICCGLAVLALRSGWLPWLAATDTRSPQVEAGVTATRAPADSRPTGTATAPPTRPAAPPPRQTTPASPPATRTATAAPTAAPTSAPAPALPDDGLVGRWSLDEGSGTRANDGSGHGFHATLHGATWAAGRFGTGLSFDGGSAYLELPASPALARLHRGPFTLALWFRPAAVPEPDPSGDPGQYALLVKAGWHQGLTFSSERRFTMQHWLEGQVYESAFSSSTFAPGTFYHVAGVVDPRSSTTALYVDGRLEAERQWKAVAANLDLGSVTWKVGVADPDAEAYRWPARGIVDELVVYQRALTRAEIVQLAGLGPP